MKHSLDKYIISIGAPVINVRQDRQDCGDNFRVYSAVFVTVFLPALKRSLLLSRANLLNPRTQQSIFLRSWNRTIFGNGADPCEILGNLMMADATCALLRDQSDPPRAPGLKDLSRLLEDCEQESH